MENNSIGTVPKVIAIVVVLALVAAYMMRSPVQESGTNTASTTEVSSAEDISQIEKDAALDIGVDDLDASLDGIDAELGL